MKTIKLPQLNQYLSEIEEFNLITDWKEYSWKIFLGGKNRGKSYYCFFAKGGFFDVIKNGGRGLYLRNTQEEAEDQCFYMAKVIQQMFPNRQIIANKKGVFDKETKEQIVRVLSSKNYNKGTGNLEGFDVVFYDEFNQNLDTRSIKLLYWLPLQLNNIFRNDPITGKPRKKNLWLAGNTFSNANPIYDIFDIDDIEQDTITILDKALFLRFSSSLFKKDADDDMELLAKQSAFESIFQGNEYEYYNPFIVRQAELSEAKKLNIYLNLNNRKYEVLEVDDLIYLNLTKSFQEDATVYTDSRDLRLFNGFKDFYNSDEMKLLASRLAKKTIFFKDTNSFLFFAELFDIWEKTNKFNTAFRKL